VHLSTATRAFTNSS